MPKLERAERKAEGDWDFREGMDVFAPGGSATGEVLGVLVALVISCEHMQVELITAPIPVLLIGLFTYTCCTCTYQHKISGAQG